MSSAITNQTFRLLTAAVVTVLFCASSAALIVGWSPGASGLPADIAAVQIQE